MSEYLLGDLRVEAATGVLRPLAETYLKTVLLPSLKGTPNQRSVRELHALARVLDFLIIGRTASAADILTQWFTTVELSAELGEAAAMHADMIPAAGVTSGGIASVLPQRTSSGRRSSCGRRS